MVPFTFAENLSSFPGSKLGVLRTVEVPSAIRDVGEL